MCGVRSVVMFCYVFFLKFRLPIGLHSSCCISPTAGGTFQKSFTKYHDWPDATQCTFVICTHSGPVNELLTDNTLLRRLIKCRRTIGQSLGARLSWRWTLPSGSRPETTSWPVPLRSLRKCHRVHLPIAQTDRWDSRARRRPLWMRCWFQGLVIKHSAAGINKLKNKIHQRGEYHRN